MSQQQQQHDQLRKQQQQQQQQQRQQQPALLYERRVNANSSARVAAAVAATTAATTTSTSSSSLLPDISRSKSHLAFSANMASIASQPSTSSVTNSAPRLTTVSPGDLPATSLSLTSDGRIHSPRSSPRIASVSSALADVADVLPSVSLDGSPIRASSKLSAIATAGIQGAEIRHSTIKSRKRAATQSSPQQLQQLQQQQQQHSLSQLSSEIQIDNHDASMSSRRMASMGLLQHSQATGLPTPAASKATGLGIQLSDASSSFRSDSTLTAPPASKGTTAIITPYPTPHQHDSFIESRSQSQPPAVNNQQHQQYQRYQQPQLQSQPTIQINGVPMGHTSSVPPVRSPSTVSSNSIDSHSSQQFNVHSNTVRPSPTNVTMASVLELPFPVTSSSDPYSSISTTATTTEPTATTATGPTQYRMATAAHRAASGPSRSQSMNNKPLSRDLLRVKNESDSQVQQRKGHRRTQSAGRYSDVKQTRKMDGPTPCSEEGGHKIGHNGICTACGYGGPHYSPPATATASVPSTEHSQVSVISGVRHSRSTGSISHDRSSQSQRHRESSSFASVASKSDIKRMRSRSRSRNRGAQRISGDIMPPKPPMIKVSISKQTDNGHDTSRILDSLPAISKQISAQSQSQSQQQQQSRQTHQTHPPPHQPSPSLEVPVVSRDTTRVPDSSANIARGSTESTSNRTAIDPVTAAAVSDAGLLITLPPIEKTGSGFKGPKTTGDIVGGVLPSKEFHPEPKISVAVSHWPFGPQKLIIVNTDRAGRESSSVSAYFDCTRGYLKYMVGRIVFIKKVRVSGTKIQAQGKMKLQVIQQRKLHNSRIEKNIKSGQQHQRHDGPRD
ncbi:hypothetical protein GQ42DRAFT_152050 [Ramicandelaber brevisporus]|nr:hypothetical protein GQ42DRAFT_152050 [Ramicandelaber brevisporus]